MQHLKLPEYRKTILVYYTNQHKLSQVLPHPPLRIERFLLLALQVRAVLKLFASEPEHLAPDIIAATNRALQGSG
jgi:hypothetical protein